MKTKVLLIGGYSEAIFLANSLLKKGCDVIAVNNDHERCYLLAEIDKLTVYHGDGSKPHILEDANAFEADIAIALTEKDEDNLVICQLCKKRFRVKKTVALISDPKKIDFFYRMGIDSVVCAVSTIASVIEQQAFVDEIETVIPVGQGFIKIVQIHISNAAPSLGMKISEISLPREVIIGCILRGEKTIIPRGDTTIQLGDILVLITSDEHEHAAVKVLAGR